MRTELAEGHCTPPSVLARSILQTLLRQLIAFSQLLLAAVVARSLGSGDGKTERYNQRVKSLEPLSARDDGIVVVHKERGGTPAETPEPAETSKKPSTEPSKKPSTEPFAEDSEVEPEQSSLVVRLTSDNTRLLKQLTTSEREARASRQVMKLVLDFVEIAMSSPGLDDKTTRLDLLDALDKIEARAISGGFDQGDLVQRLNDMVDKYRR